MVIKKTEDKALINQLRTVLYLELTSPIDSMWESLYIANAQNYVIEDDNHIIGYCSVDDNQTLLQFYLSNDYKQLAKKTITALLKQKVIRKAKLSTNEPIGFNACVALSSRIKEDTFCYAYTGKPKNEGSITVEKAQLSDVESIKEFYKTQVGFEDTFGYTENLINRQELYLAKNNKEFIGTGECRLSETQPNIADVGVAVHTDHRRKGYASQILRLLVNETKSTNRKPICSTTVDNIASQKAIENAGFYCSNIIFEIHF